MLDGEETLRQFIRNAPVAIAMLDGAMRYIAVSHGWRADCGLGDEGIIGRSPDEVFAEVPVGWKDAHRRGLAGEVVSADGGRFVRADGRERWLRWEVRPWNGVDGRVGGVFVFTEDMTARNEGVIALREREERLRTVLNTAIDAIVTIDRRGVMTSVNPATERMFGYTEAELVGENVSILMPAPHRDEHDGYIARYLETGEARIIGIGREVLGRRKDGSTFAADLAVGEMDHLGSFVGSIRDISDRRHAEEQVRNAERLSSIGTLAAGLGHDLNNVLLPVRARLDIIESAELPAAIREHFAEIRKSAGYMQDLADGLHLLALDPDDADACVEATDLHEWWHHTSTLLRRALPKHVRFGESFEPGLPRIRVQPHRLTQAVLNVLVNAGNAVDERGAVRLSARRSSGDTVRIEVTDNGCGMTPEVRRRALEPFFTTKRRGLGTGLGLSLVQGVVRSSGGAVTIDSTVGRGTTIVLEFPVVPEDPGIEPGARVRPKAIVNVRDGRVESLVQSLLEAAGFDIAPARGAPSEAARLWVTEPCVEVEQALRSRADQSFEVIVLGEAAAGWAGRECVVVADPTRFDSVRAAIGDAATRVSP